MELLPGEQRLANVEVMELLAARRKARAASKALHKRREGNFTPTKECRWVEAKVSEASLARHHRPPCNAGFPT